jgi:hypothetical protein
LSALRRYRSSPGQAYRKPEFRIDSAALLK